MRPLNIFITTRLFFAVQPSGKWIFLEVTIAASFASYPIDCSRAHFKYVGC